MDFSKTLFGPISQGISMAQADSVRASASASAADVDMLHQAVFGVDAATYRRLYAHADIPEEMGAAYSKAELMCARMVSLGFRFDERRGLIRDMVDTSYPAVSANRCIVEELCLTTSV